jgi:hypothetical protein
VCSGASILREVITPVSSLHTIPLQQSVLRGYFLLSSPLLMTHSLKTKCQKYVTNDILKEKMGVLVMFSGEL